MTHVRPKSLELEILPKQELVFAFEKSYAGSSGEPYIGPYVAYPTWNNQTLSTHGKIMYNDVTVYSIPYQEINNVGYIAPNETPTITKTLSKVVAGSSVLMDLTNDTITAPYLKAGLTAHKADGSQITGTATVTYISETKELIVPSWALEVE